jgi:tRNA-specific 2-thiouridylase
MQTVVDVLMAQALQAMHLPPAARVVVAMSGGVDSSVVAALLAHAGYEVLGVTLQLYDQGARAARKGACCAGQDIYDAKQVADHMGFPHYVLDYASRFQESVMETFADSYLAGETPVPCVQCNREVKFKDLLKVAQDLGADALVTGHYVQRLVQDGQAQLHQAIDPSRDQSYFLFGTTQAQLDFLRFPLGGLHKTQTRELASFFGLNVSDKPDSQDICFVAGGSYASVVAKLRPESLISGDIVHTDGRILGRHEGVIHFTVGQRRGLKIASPEPLFVVRLDTVHHRVIVGPREALACAQMSLREVNWLFPDALLPSATSSLGCHVKIRSSQKALPASLSLDSHNTLQVTLASPEYGISKGQACVFYHETRVIGGGWIDETAPPLQPTP